MEIKNELGNLEGCLFKLQSQNKLIDLVADRYFGKNNVKKEDEWELAWEYKTYQALMYSISYILKDVEKDLKENVYSIYDSLKEARNEK